MISDSNLRHFSPLNCGILDVISSKEERPSMKSSKPGTTYNKEPSTMKHKLLS